MKEKISVQNFVEEFINKKITNTKLNDHAVEDFIHEKLDIVEYIPFKTKREIVKTIVKNVVTEEDGIKKIDSVSQFLSFIVAMVVSHTTLVFSNKPEEDYDALSQCGVLEYLVAIFQRDYTQCEALLKAAIADELQDNNLSVVVSKFLNGILDKLDGFGETVKGFTENLDLSKLLGTNINDEEKTKILGLIDKLNK